MNWSTIFLLFFYAVIAFLRGSRDLVRPPLGFPHQNQSAFRKHVGCSVAIIATQELIARYISKGSTVHMCRFELEKAYDSVEFAVLLDQLFSIGVNGKTRCLIRSWYENGRCCVKVDGRSSPTFSVERGVHQGSVLLPTLFNIVMDPLLRSIEAAGLGLCVNNLYGGAYLHTDDIRTVATSVSTLRVQISKVLEFASYHWNHDLSAKPSVGYNITKA